MRRYDDPVDVRRGMVQGAEAPAQFVWRDRLWVVCEVVAHWVETGSWWERAGAYPPPGPDDADLLAEREVWRVDAARGRANRGVFDLTFHWAAGQWQLTRALD